MKQVTKPFRVILALARKESSRPFRSPLRRALLGPCIAGLALAACQATSRMAAAPENSNLAKEMNGEENILLSWDQLDPQKTGYTELHRAAAAGNSTLVRELIEAGLNPNTTDRSGNTAIHEAAWEGHPGVVKTLLALGAEPNAGNITGHTAYNFAVQSGHEEVMKILTEARGGKKQPDENKKSILWKKILEILLRKSTPT